MRTLLAGGFVLILLGSGLAGGWFAMNYYYPGGAGTPAHAGALTNGHPEDCTNVNFNVRPRSTETRRIALETGDLLRGTFEADGGFGRVDVFMRIISPNGDDMAASPRAAHYDFTLPAKYRGEYALLFDNRYSMFTAKSIGLYYCIDHGRPQTPEVFPPIPQ